MVSWQTLYITPTKAPYILGIPGLHGFAVTQPDWHLPKEIPNTKPPDAAHSQNPDACQTLAKSAHLPHLECPRRLCTRMIPSPKTTTPLILNFPDGRVQDQQDSFRPDCSCNDKEARGRFIKLVATAEALSCTGRQAGACP